MKETCVLSIAGLDPCGGAGLVADARTIESFGLRALTAASAVTHQNDNNFYGIEWIDVANIRSQLEPLYQAYHIAALKVGLVENLQVLYALLRDFKELFPRAAIVWDPIVKASAGFEFHKRFLADELSPVFELVTAITPNREEIFFLGSGTQAEKIASEISQVCGVILKGGHDDGSISKDMLFWKGRECPFQVDRQPGSGRHGTGCVYSAALAAQLAKGLSLERSCHEAQRRVLGYLQAGEMSWRESHGNR